MEWTDDGIVLGTRRHGESSAILELMTRDHGRHLGLVRGGSGSRMRPVLQPGNLLRVSWRARLDEHLGHYAVEGLNLRAGALLSLPYAVYALTHLAALARLLPERDPHEGVFDALDAIFDRLDVPMETATSVVRFELELLSELGFGLDLESCAATGSARDLAYVSPKSGRAVSRIAGEPWQHRLLQFPAFLVTPQAEAPTPAELADAFMLTGFFLERRVTEPRGQTLPDARSHFIAAVLKTQPPAQSRRA
jgi:DNA repair protein RecO (recombination protein O)